MPSSAVIYARISKDDPAVGATADQERRCRELAEREGYAVTKVFADDGISGFTGKFRPGWIALNHAIKSGMVDVILAVAEDRFTRNQQEKEGLKVECARHGVKWHTVAGGLVDPSTAGGSLMATLTGGIAEYESRIKSERVAASVVRRRLEGKDIGGPRPFGFSIDRRSLVEAEAALVREGYATLLSGATTYAVLKRFINSDVPPVRAEHWTWVTVKKILTRPRNAGLAITNEGEVYELTEHPAIVSREDFEAVSAILAPSRAATGRRPQHLASGGVAKCGTCGSSLRYSSQRGTYRCDLVNSGAAGRKDGRKHATVKAADLDARIAIEVVPALLSRLRGGKDSNVEDGVRILVARRTQLEGERDDLQELWTLPGANKVKLRAQLASYAEQLEAVDAQITDAQLSALTNVQAIARALLAVDDAGSFEESWNTTRQAADLFKERWADMPLDEKRALVRAVLDVRIHPASFARDVRIVESEAGAHEVVVTREGPERISIRHI